jgi:hypothetical protein
MAGLVPAIHVFIEATIAVDARDKRGHDGRKSDSTASPGTAGAASPLVCDVKEWCSDSNQYRR